MSKKLKVTSIEIKKKDGTVVKLTVDEARDLFFELEGFFGSPKEQTTLPYPIYVSREVPVWQKDIWCSSNGGALCVRALTE